MLKKHDKTGEGQAKDILHSLKCADIRLSAIQFHGFLAEKMCTQENGSPRQDGKNGQLSQPQRLVAQRMHLRK